MRRVLATLRRRPPEVLALAGLFGGAAALLAIAIAFPLSERAPVRLGSATLAVALALAVGTLVLGRRLPRVALLAQVAFAVLANSVLVAYAHTRAGATGDALAYTWLVAYVALFFPRSAVPCVALVVVSFGVALLASGLPAMFTIWALVSVTVLMLGLVLSRLSRTVRQRLVTDDLTGAVTRSGLEPLARRQRRRADHVTVAALDFDAFKSVNEAEGHAGGDRLLTEAVAAWRAALRDEDVLARTGGDEFVVIMPSTSPEQAAAVLERLRAAHPASWSAGIARWRDGETLEACLERADRRLYAAKAARRDTR
jgi:diguanylate cyclase (GGDEF)-like protein